MPEYFQKTTLPSGLRVLTFARPDVQSVSLGVWLNAGSIYEKKRENGLAHLLEHMVFKGTKKHSMAQIAAQMDVLGGGMNAFTEREFVCYHVKVLAEQTVPALELMASFVTFPLLDEKLLEVEKSVVLEEIRGALDEPDERVEDLFMANLWQKSRWGRPILGETKTVANFSRADLKAFMENHYSPCNCVVVAVGRVEHEKIVAQAARHFKDLPGSGQCSRPLPREPMVRAHRAIQKAETEGAHIILGTRAFAYDDPKRYAAWALDTILTGGYSSRLFQEVREKRGLCYSIGGLSASYRTAGFWAVEIGVAPENAQKTLNIIARELRKIEREGVKKSELVRAKQMARVNILLAQESQNAQMNRIARNELYFGQQKETGETLRAIEAVSREEIQAVAREIFDPQFINLAAVGPMGKLEFEI